MPFIFTHRVFRWMALGVFALLLPITSIAEEPNEGMVFLGQPFPEVVIGTLSSQVQISEDDIDALFDLPAARGLDALLSAENKTRTIRGGKGIAINRKVAPATVFLQQGASLCSGAIVGSDGQIVTCWHCVRGGGDILVRLHPDIGWRPLTRARLLRADPSLDLALLQLIEPPPKLVPMEIGVATDMEIGSDVYAVGHPSGLAWSIVKGMISQIHEKRVWNFEQNRHEAEVIQSQIHLYPGNSGGPLVSDKGMLIGINAARRENERFTFAISVAEVRKFLGAEGRTAEVVARNGAICKRRKMLEGRNVENTANVTLYDTNCDGVSDTALIVPDDGSKAVAVARAGDLRGRIDAVRVGRNGHHSTYVSGKKSTIKLDEALKTEILPASVR